MKSSSNIKYSDENKPILDKISLILAPLSRVDLNCSSCDTVFYENTSIDHTQLKCNERSNTCCGNDTTKLEMSPHEKPNFQQIDTQQSQILFSNRILFTLGSEWCLLVCPYTLK